jgi:hypothetical protein
VQAPDPHCTAAPVHGVPSAPHSMLQGPSPQITLRSPQASTPPPQVIEHAAPSGQLIVVVSQASAPLQSISQA